MRHVSTRFRRGAAALGVGALVAAGGVVLTSAPAQAASTGTYSCLIPGLIENPEDAVKLDITLDIDLPDTGLPGPAADKNVTGKIVISDDLAGLMSAVGATKVNATVTGKLSANGAETGYSATKNDIAAQTTAFSVDFNGPIAPDITVDSAGPTTVTAGQLDLKVDLFDANGPLATVPTVTLNCTPPVDLAPVDTVKLANYKCVALGTLELGLQITSSSNLPATGTVGTPMNVTYAADVALGPDLAGLMSAFGVATVDATATGTVTGPDGAHTWTNSKTGLSVPATGAVVDLEAPLTPAVTPAAAGTLQLKAGDIALSVATFKPDGTPHALGTLELPCTPVPADQVVSSSTISAAATTTTLTIAPASPKAGSTVTATAKVTSSTGTPTGAVKFTWAGGSKSVALAGGSAKVSIPKAKAGSLKVTAAYAGAPAFKASSATRSVTVKKIATKTKVKATGKRKKVGKATITVSPKTTGTVVLKAKGALKKTFKAKVKNGKVVIKLGKLKKKGKITLVATFKGTSTHAASVSKKFVLKVK